MSDTVLWVIAVGSGLLGLLLLMLAGAVALYWKVAAPTPPRKPQSGETIAAGGEHRPVATSAAGGGPWLWVKACIFAIVHAGTVSLVLGGITFFEDIARASDEIQRSGTVNFPRQLLPGALSEASANRRLPGPAGKKQSTGEGAPKKSTRAATSSPAAAWEVISDEPSEM